MTNEASEKEPRTRGAAGVDVDEELRRLKLEVLSRIAHDVRAPLSVVLTGLKELRETAPAFDDYQRSVFKLVCSSAETSLQLLKDLHDLARLEESCLPLAKARADLASLARTVVGSVQAKVQDTKATVRFEEPDQPVPLEIDEGRMGQVLGNLLENALRIARASVVMRLSSGPDEVRVQIDDDGPGIQEDALEAIFDSTSHKAVRPGGTGLGLAVARGLVEAHGGKLWAENRVDESGAVAGARFVVSLPR